MSDSVRPLRGQPTRLLRPWDSPDKNTGVGCHFLLQCMKVKSKSEVTQSCPTLRDPMDCSPPGSSAHGIFQARVLEWVAIAFSVAWYFFKKSQAYTRIAVEELRRKGCVSLKGPKQKQVGSETEASWGSLEVSTVWTVLLRQGRGCFIVVG